MCVCVCVCVCDSLFLPWVPKVGMGQRWLGSGVRSPHISGWGGIGPGPHISWWYIMFGGPSTTFGGVGG